MAETSDGFVIAERDLRLRGPGDFFGTRQSGLPTLRAGDLMRDADLLERAFEEARARVEAGTLTAAQQDLRAQRLAAAIRTDHCRLSAVLLACWPVSPLACDANHRRHEQRPHAEGAEVGRPAADLG